MKRHFNDLYSLKENSKGLLEKIRKMHRQESQRSQSDHKLGSGKSALTASTNSMENDVPGVSTGSSTSFNARVTQNARKVRGETSRRIQNLLDDWKDYKDTADEEIRRRMRAEQILHDAVAQKQKELNQQEFELTSLRSLSYEQKQIIAQLRTQVEEDAKCKQHCVQLELQLSKYKERTTEMQAEVRQRNDAITSLQLERESLLQLNGILKATNTEQKSRIETSEKEVSETRLELEVIEDMIQHLYAKKVFPLRATPLSSRRTSPVAENSAFKRTTSTPKKRGVVIEPAPGGAGVSSIAASFGDTAMPSESGTTTTVEDDNGGSYIESSINLDKDSSRKIGERPSAMTALRSLQQSHNEQCSHLADHIEKLKQNSRLRETDLSNRTNQSEK